MWRPMGGHGRYDRQRMLGQHRFHDRIEELRLTKRFAQRPVVADGNHALGHNCAHDVDRSAEINRAETIEVDDGDPLPRRIGAKGLENVVPVLGAATFHRPRRHVALDNVRERIVTGKDDAADAF